VSDHAERGEDQDEEEQRRGDAAGVDLEMGGPGGHFGVSFLFCPSAAPFAACACSVIPGAEEATGQAWSESDHERLEVRLDG